MELTTSKFDLLRLKKQQQFQLVLTQTDMSIHAMNKLMLKHRKQLKDTKEKDYQFILLIDESPGGDFYSHIRNLFIVAHDMLERFQWVIVTRDSNKNRSVEEERFYDDFLTRNIKCFFPKTSILVR